MGNAASDLPENVAALQAMVLSKDGEIRVRDLMIEKLKHQLAGHQKHRFGSKSETLDQLALDIEDREIAKAVTKPQSEERPTTPKDKPKRKPLPPELPREEEVLPAGECCASCGGKLKHLGEDVTEELEYVPGRFKVRRIVRPRCACADCEAMHQAPLPSRPPSRRLLRNRLPGNDRARASGAGIARARAGQQIRRPSPALPPEPDLRPQRS